MLYIMNIVYFSINDTTYFRHYNQLLTRTKIRLYQRRLKALLCIYLLFAYIILLDISEK